MKMSTGRLANPRRGLAMLSMHQRPVHFFHFEQASRLFARLTKNPFRPDEKPRARHSIICVGHETATDRLVEAFVIAIRNSVGCTPENIIAHLRIIEAPLPKRDGKGNHIFFEVVTPSNTIISGAINYKGSAGKEAREQLEDVFTALSLTHNVPPQWVTLDKAVDARLLQEV